MRIRRDVVAGILAVATVGCGGSGSASLDTDDQKASYAIGLGMGENLKPTGDHLDLAALRVGIEDALAERDTRVPEEELQAIMTVFNQTIQAEMQAEQEALAQTNTEEGAAYLAENGGREEVTTTASGLQYEVLRDGDGASPGAGDQATINYRGTLIDGTEFDSSYERGEPATFQVGGVIPGFAEGLQLMTVGSHYRFVIPGDIAYGPGGNGRDIGPNATLIFEVELLELPAAQEAPGE